MAAFVTCQQALLSGSPWVTASFVCCHSRHRQWTTQVRVGVAVHSVGIAEHEAPINLPDELTNSHCEADQYGDEVKDWTPEETCFDSRKGQHLISYPIHPDRPCSPHSSLLNACLEFHTAQACGMSTCLLNMTTQHDYLTVHRLAQRKRISGAVPQLHTSS